MSTQGPAPASSFVSISPACAPPPPLPSLGWLLCRYSGGPDTSAEGGGGHNADQPPPFPTPALRKAVQRLQARVLLLEAGAHGAQGKLAPTPTPTPVRWLSLGFACVGFNVQARAQPPRAPLSVVVCLVLFACMPGWNWCGPLQFFFATIIVLMNEKVEAQVGGVLLRVAVTLVLCVVSLKGF